MTVMTAEPRTLRTKAEEGLIALYEAVRTRLPGNEAALTRRDRAFALFERNGLPHRRVEAWKYTDLRTVLRTVPPLASEAGKTELAALAKTDPLASLDRARLVVANGVYRPDLSDLGDVQGVTVEPLADVLARSPEQVGRLFAEVDDPVLALNTALASGGVAVSVAKNAAPGRPVEIVHLTAGGSPVSAFVRNVIDVGAGANIRLIESHRGTADVGHQVNSATELAVGDGARVSFVRLQAESDAATHLASFAARIGRDVHFDHLAVNAGAGLSRWQGFVTIAGTGAEIAFYGATMLSGREHGDTALEVIHAVPHGRSREQYKSVVDGDAFGAFQGRIVVKPHAQKTDAKMMTQALLLSDAAQFAAKPELEIFADDVQCGHGATSGRIDENHLFYLMARGVPRAEAERLLIEAFLADPIDAIGDEKIADALKGTIAAWLARRRRSVEAA
jgi:Fe-S cluster assembly protein SufD